MYSDVSSHLKNVTMVNRFSNLKRRENPGNASVTPVPKARSDSRETLSRFKRKTRHREPV